MAKRRKVARPVTGQNKIESRWLKSANVSGTTLVIGSRVYDGRYDRRLLYPEAVGIDPIPGEGVDEVASVCNYRQMSTIAESVVDEVTHIDCASVLEHCEDPIQAMSIMEALLPEGGTVFLTVPFVWREHSYPNDLFRFSKDGLRTMAPCIHWHFMEYVCNNRVVKKPPVIMYRGVPYFGRTEVYAFGEKV